MLRLAGASSIFLFDRIRPGVFLTVARGDDTGDLGSAPLDLITRECRLFSKPVQWLFDASAVTRASVSVSQNWAAWLRALFG